MKPEKTPPLISLLISVCFLCTSLSFAQTTETEFGFEWSDSSAFAQLSFKKLPGIFNYLASQESFQSQIETDLMAQYFSEIHAMLITHERTLEKALSPGGITYDDPELNVINTVYLNERERFKLNPEESERLAVTQVSAEQPIYINLKLLNELKPGLTDLIQLFVHELGHKIATDKDQGTVDRLGALIKDTIEPFYSRRSYSGKEYHILNIPELRTPTSTQNFFSSPFLAFMLIRDENGKTENRLIDYSDFVEDNSPFQLTQTPDPSIDFAKADLIRLSLTDVDETGFKFKTFMESFLIQRAPGNSNESGALQKYLNTILRRRGAAPYFNADHFTRITRPVLHSNTAKIPLSFERPSQNNQQAMIEMLPVRDLFQPSLEVFVVDSRVESTASGKSLITVQLAAPLHKDLHLELDYGLSATLVKGAPAVGTDSRAFTFIIDPKDLIQDQRLTRVVVDGKHYASLPKVQNLKGSSTTQPLYPFENGDIQVKTRKGWTLLPFNQMDLDEKDSFMIRFKLLDSLNIDKKNFRGARFAWQQNYDLVSQSTEFKFGQVTQRAEDLISDESMKIIVNEDGSYLEISTDPRDLKFDSPGLLAKNLEWKHTPNYRISEFSIHLKNGVNILFPMEQRVEGFRLHAKPRKLASPMSCGSFL